MHHLVLSFSFSFKTFSSITGWRESLQTLLFLVTGRPGYTAWLLCVLIVGQQEIAGGLSISSQFLSAL